MTERRVSSVRGYLPMLGGQAAAVAAAFLVSVIVVRATGAEGRGVVALITTATILAAAVTSSGLEGAMAREAGARNERAGAMALWWVATAGVTFSAAWAAVALMSADFWRLDPAAAAALAAGGMAIVFSTSLLRGVLLGRGRYREIGTGRAIGGVFGLVVILGLALAGILSPELAIAVGFAAMLLQGAVYWAAAGRPRRPHMNDAGRRRHVGYALRASLGTLFLSIQSRYDLLVVGALLSTSEAGIYAVMLSLSEMAWLPIDVAALMVLGSAAGSRHSLSEAARATRLVLLLAVAIAAMLVVLGPVVLAVAFGKVFLDAFHVLLILLPGAVALAVWRFAMSDAAGRGQPELRSQSAALGGSVALLLTPPAVALWGLEGAALVSSLTYVITAAAGLRRYSRRYGVPVRTLTRISWDEVRALSSMGRIRHET